MSLEERRDLGIIEYFLENGVPYHTDPEITERRKLTLKKWMEVYMEFLRYSLSYNTFCRIFENELCWSGTRLDNVFLGRMLTEDRFEGITDPCEKYKIACTYCVIDRIQPLFQNYFERFKRTFSLLGLSRGNETQFDQYVRKAILDNLKNDSDDYDFWIDRESGKLKQHNSAEGFDRAVSQKWSEGVEYFYHRLKEEDKDRKLRETILALAHDRAEEEDGPILDFCVINTVDKDALLERLLRKKNGAYSLMHELQYSCFFDTVHDLVECWCYRKVWPDGDYLKKIFSSNNYELLLWSLSMARLERPEMRVQARILFLYLWRCDNLIELKDKCIIDPLTNKIVIDDLLAVLIINWDACKRDIEDKEEIAEILTFIRQYFVKNRNPRGYEYFKETLITNLRENERDGSYEGVDYARVGEELLSDLEKTANDMDLLARPAEIYG